MKRPRTGKPVNIRDFQDSESLLQAKRLYDKMYGRLLRTIPAQLTFSPDFLRVEICLTTGYTHADGRGNQKIANSRRPSRPLLVNNPE